MTLAAEAPNWADILAAVGQALGALFTAAAVGFAFWLSRRDQRWRRQDQRASDADQLDREAAQARLITVTSPASSGVQFDDSDAVEFQKPTHVTGHVARGHVVHITIRNGSQHSIFHPRVLEVRLLGRQATRTERLRPRDGAWDRYRPEELTPGDTIVVPVVCVQNNGEPQTSLLGAIGTVKFTDANGLKWSREGTNPPRRLLLGQIHERAHDRVADEGAAATSPDGSRQIEGGFSPFYYDDYDDYDDYLYDDDEFEDDEFDEDVDDGPDDLDEEVAGRGRPWR